jgi:hypothetical protein
MDRQLLVEKIEAALRECERAGGALVALDALGYTVGRMFRDAPDIECRMNGRVQFLAAVQAGLDGEPADKGALN